MVDSLGVSLRDSPSEDRSVQKRAFGESQLCRHCERGVVWIGGSLPWLFIIRRDRERLE